VRTLTWTIGPQTLSVIDVGQSLAQRGVSVGLDVNVPDVGVSSKMGLRGPAPKHDPPPRPPDCSNCGEPLTDVKYINDRGRGEATYVDVVCGNCGEMVEEDRCVKYPEPDF